MALRRGFKSEANAYARELRQDLNLAPHDPLCPFELADMLEVRTIPLRQFANDEPDACAYFETKKGKEDFSAITLCFGPERHVIYNDFKSQGRSAADVAHELAHIILLHPPKPPFDENGSRHYNRELEDEANWLGPALLVSEEAALSVVKQGLSESAAARVYGVTTSLMRMRLNVVGAHRRVRR